MGIDFRGKGYKRFVRIGKRTVKEGECVAVWDQYGRHREIRGPTLVRLWWSTIRFLEHHIALSEEYIRIQKRDGTIEHIRGPGSIYENPVFHHAVSVQKAIVLPDASSHIVVFKQSSSVSASSSESGSETLRKIVNGPTTYFPDPTDKLHVFEWTADGGGALSKDLFVLRLQQQVVRAFKLQTGDANGHVATVMLDLRARVIGVEEALSTSDPIAACDALTQAVVRDALATCDFGAQGTSLHITVQEALGTDTFMSKLKDLLGKQASLSLLSLAVAGVEPSAELAKLQRKEDDLANAKVAEQLAAMTLDAAVARQEREQKLEIAKQTHELALEAERHEAARSYAEQQDKRRIENLKELKKLNVDLTKYLTASVGRAGGDELTSETKGGPAWSCWAA